MTRSTDPKLREPTFTTAVLVGIIVMLAICVAVVLSDGTGRLG